MNAEIKQLLQDMEILLSFAMDGKVPSYSTIRSIDDNLAEFKLKSIFNRTSDDEIV